MTLPVSRGRGGFQKPIQLSLFIRDELADGRETWAQQLYGDYTDAVEKIPLKVRQVRGKPGRPRIGAKRQVISYEGFRNYLYVMRRLGLIEYVTTPTGEILTEQALNKGGQPAPYLAERRYFRANPSELDNPAWSNIWEAYRSI